MIKGIKFESVQGINSSRSSTDTPPPNNLRKALRRLTHSNGSEFTSSGTPSPPPQFIRNSDVYFFGGGTVIINDGYPAPATNKCVQISCENDQPCPEGGTYELEPYTLDTSCTHISGSSTREPRVYCHMSSLDLSLSNSNRNFSLYFRNGNLAFSNSSGSIISSRPTQPGFFGSPLTIKQCSESDRIFRHNVMFNSYFSGTGTVPHSNILFHKGFPPRTKPEWVDMVSVSLPTPYLDYYTYDQEGSYKPIFGSFLMAPYTLEGCSTRRTNPSDGNSRMVTDCPTNSINFTFTSPQKDAQFHTISSKDGVVYFSTFGPSGTIVGQIPIISHPNHQLLIRFSASPPPAHPPAFPPSVPIASPSLPHTTTSTTFPPIVPVLQIVPPPLPPTTPTALPPVVPALQIEPPSLPPIPALPTPPSSPNAHPDHSQMGAHIAMGAGIGVSGLLLLGSSIKGLKMLCKAWTSAHRARTESSIIVTTTNVELVHASPARSSSPARPSIAPNLPNENIV